MSDEEEFISYAFPIRRIAVSFGADEDGGGITIEVQLDGEDPRRVKEIVLEILREVNRVGERKESSETGYV
ncbi:MAG: hypothetical protein PWR13_1087 [Archaeoglobi archaeon]|nr:hypothetical protein [Archaeoglobi archaeon]